MINMVASGGVEVLTAPATPPPSPNMSSGSSQRSNSSKFTKRQWMFATVFGVVHFATAACISLQAPFYPEEAESKGVTPSQYGFVFGIFELTSFISSPFFGKYLTQMGPTFTYNAGIFVAAFCSFLFGILDLIQKMEDFLILSFAVRIVESLGTSASVTASFTIIALEFPETVATTFASLETFFGLGLIAGPTIGGILFQIGGYKTPFIVMGGVLISAAALTFFILPDFQHPCDSNRDDDESIVQAPSISPQKDGIFAALSSPSIFFDMLSISTTSMSIGFLAATLEPHLRQFSLSPSVMGAVFVVNGGTYAVSAPLVGWLCDKGIMSAGVALCIGHALIAASYFLTGPAPFLIGVPTLLWLAIVGLLVNGAGGGLILVPAFVDGMASALSSGFPEGVSTYSVISGLWASAFALGAFVGPSIGGILFDSVGFRMGSMVISAIHIACIFVHIIYRLIKRMTANKNDIYSNQLLLPSSDIHSNCLLTSNSSKSGGEYGSLAMSL